MNKVVLGLGAGLFLVVVFAAFRQGQAQAAAAPLRFVIYPHPIDPTDLAVSEWIGGVAQPWRDGSVVLERLRSQPTALVELLANAAVERLAMVDQLRSALETAGHTVTVDAVSAVPPQPPPAAQFG